MSTSPSATTSNFSPVTTGTGSTRSAPSSPKMRRGDLVGEVDLEALDVAGHGVAGGEPERVLVDADAQEPAFADLLDAPPSAGAHRGSVGSRGSSSRSSLVVALGAGSATSPSWRRRRLGDGGLRHRLGAGRRARPATSEGGSARDTAHASIATGRGRQRATARISGTPAVVGCSPTTMATPAAIAARTTSDREHDREVPRPIGVVAQCRRRALDQLGQLRRPRPCGLRLTVDGDVNGGRVLAARRRGGAPRRGRRGTRRSGPRSLGQRFPAGPVGRGGDGRGREAHRRRRRRGCRRARRSPRRYCCSVPRSMRSRFSSLSDRSVTIRAVDSVVTRSDPSSRDSASASRLAVQDERRSSRRRRRPRPRRSAGRR